MSFSRGSEDTHTKKVKFVSQIPAHFQPKFSAFMIDDFSNPENLGPCCTFYSLLQKTKSKYCIQGLGYNSLAKIFLWYFSYAISH